MRTKQNKELLANRMRIAQTTASALRSFLMEAHRAAIDDGDQFAELALADAVGQAGMLESRVIRLASSAGVKP